MASVDQKPERSALLANADPGVTLTIRLLMQGKEVGGIIGKKGEIVKRIREESGAIIRISDGSVPERIVTISGTTESIIKAFDLICNKFEEDMESSPSIGSGNVPKPPITLRLIVPASQCGSLIGKGGSKIKEIREVTGASIQVASEMLPNSTERAVTVSGASEAIELCIQHICAIMIESPPKGATIPYRPKPCTSSTNTGPSMLMTAGAVPALQGNLAGITSPADVTKLLSLGLGTGLGLTQAANLGALTGFRTQDHGRGGNNQQTHEMTVPNELIGCIIGKGGSKISEIRQLSGAMIRISNCEDVEGGKTDRTIIISGSGDAVALAQYLINASIDLQKAQVSQDGKDSESGSGGDVAMMEGESSSSPTNNPNQSSKSSSSTSSALASLPLSLNKVLGSSPALLATILNLGNAAGAAATAPGMVGGVNNALVNAVSLALLNLTAQQSALSAVQQSQTNGGDGGGGSGGRSGGNSHHHHQRGPRFSGSGGSGSRGSGGGGGGGGGRFYDDEVTGVHRSSSSSYRGAGGNNDRHHSNFNGNNNNNSNRDGNNYSRNRSSGASPGRSHRSDRSRFNPY